MSEKRRGAPASGGLQGPDGDLLGFQDFINAVVRALAPDARLFPAADGHGPGRDDSLVAAPSPELQQFCHAHRSRSSEQRRLGTTCASTVRLQWGSSAEKTTKQRE